MFGVWLPSQGHLTVFQVVIGPNLSLPEGTVVSMHHPDEQEEDEDEFLSDDAEIGQSKEKSKQKGVCRQM